MTREIGAVNVTFECLLLNDAGNQVTTIWNIWNFRGVAGGRSILLVLPDAIYEGNPDGTLFATFRNILTFPVFIEDLDGASLSCGSQLRGFNLTTGWFLLKAYRKCTMISNYPS